MNETYWLLLPPWGMDVEMDYTLNFATYPPILPETEVSPIERCGVSRNENGLTRQEITHGLPSGDTTDTDFSLQNNAPNVGVVRLNSVKNGESATERGVTAAVKRRHPLAHPRTIRGEVAVHF